MADRLIIGVGNRDRGDDAVGPIVCDLVKAGGPGTRTLVLEGSVVDLPMRWQPDDRVVIVDASAPAGEPGRVTVVDALRERLVAPSTMSTHSIDVGDAIELARTLGVLPAELYVVGVEALDDSPGVALSGPVAAAAHTIADELIVGRLPAPTVTSINRRANRRAGRT